MSHHRTLPQPKDEKDKRGIRKIYAVVLLLGISIFTYGLAGYAITGSYARYVQDDYCYAAILGRQGFWEGQLRSFLEETTYNGNRFSLTFFMGLSESIGRFSVGVLPGLAVILWVAGFILVLRNASRVFAFPLSWIETFFLAEALVFLTLSQAPNLAQVLYWRPGMLPYLAPLVTQTFLVSSILGEMRRGRSSPVILAGIVLLSLLGAGFSETAAAFQAGLCALILITAYAGLLAKVDYAPSAYRASWAALLGTLLGMLLLVISPAGRRGLDMAYGSPQNIISMIEISLDSAVYFIKFTLYRVTVPSIFTFVLFAVFGLTSSTTIKTSLLNLRHGLILFIASLVVVYFLLLCIVAPSAYVQATYPGLRALIGARMLIVLWLALLGFSCGTLARRALPDSRLETVYLGIAGLLFSTLIILLYQINPGSLQDPAFPDIRSFAMDSPLLFILLPLLGLVFGAGLALFINWRRLGRTGFTLALLALLTGLFLHPIKSSQAIYTQIPSYQKRAALWDHRDAEIRKAEEDGLRNIQVPAIDSLAGVSELQENPGNWINRCAAWLYGMESISAIPK